MKVGIEHPPALNHGLECPRNFREGSLANAREFL
jgi:hypothetical protein